MLFNSGVLPTMIASQFKDYGWLLNWCFRGVGYLGSKVGAWKAGRHEELQNRIIDYLNTQVQSSGVDGLYADIILKPILHDVPFDVAFPRRLTGSAKITHDLKRLRYEIRHRWRKMQQYVPEHEFNRLLLRLLREKRIGYDRLSERYHRL